MAVASNAAAAHVPGSGDPQAEDAAKEIVGETSGAMGSDDVDVELGRIEPHDAEVGGHDGPSVILPGTEVDSIAVHLGRNAGERPEVDVEFAAQRESGQVEGAGNVIEVPAERRTRCAECVVDLPIVVAPSIPDEFAVHRHGARGIPRTECHPPALW